MEGGKEKLGPHAMESSHGWLHFNYNILFPTVYFYSCLIYRGAIRGFSFDIVVYVSSINNL